MKQAVVILLGVLCGQIYGATYHDGPYADGFEHDGPIEPEAHEVVPPHPEVKDNSTLHKGLERHGKKGDVRAVPPPVDTAQSGVQTDIVNQHNTFRKIKASTSSFEMSWDNEAQALAQKWTANCDYRHPTQTQAEKDQWLKTSNFSCGQNIAQSTGYVMSWSDVMKMWYNEEKNFTLGAAPAAKDAVVGHYTAIVWGKTFKVGCGYTKCKAGTPSEFSFYACNYCPAGNLSPNQFSPYEPVQPGTASTSCSKCPNNCKDGLCTNPCSYTNTLTNCETKQGAYDALFPKGCDGAPDYYASFKPKCQATCNCYGKNLLY